jgi:hypothetical protein
MPLSLERALELLKKNMPKYTAPPPIPRARQLPGVQLPGAPQFELTEETGAMTKEAIRALLGGDKPQGDEPRPRQREGIEITNLPPVDSAPPEKTEDKLLRWGMGIISKMFGK